MRKDTIKHTSALRVAGICAALAYTLLFTGCGTAGGSTHTQDKPSAVDQVLTERAAEADAAAQDSGSGLILTPGSTADNADEDTQSVDEDILALARQIAEENNIQDPSLTAAGTQTDWQQLDLQDNGDGFAMAQMPEDCDVDVDLTILNSTMVYSEVYNMMYYPEKYIGKRIRMRGDYSYYKDEATGQVYLACFISDAAACCQQGIEFELSKEAAASEAASRLKPYDTVQVVGVYDTYKEGELTYCTLRNAVLE